MPVILSFGWLKQEGDKFEANLWVKFHHKTKPKEVSTGKGPAGRAEGCRLVRE